MPHIHGIDSEFIANEYGTWDILDNAPTATITAGPQSDIFINPNRTVSSPATLNAPTLLTQAPDGDWQLSAKVTVDFNSTFDAGVLLIWFNEEYWAKLCFEYNPKNQPSAVAVVNRVVSDDANGPTVDSNTIWLRISRYENIVAFHTSHDSHEWDLLRVFDLDVSGAPAYIGLEGQAPTGEGCTVTFEHISLTRTTLKDLRDGS